jgi:hypothetical protein
LAALELVYDLATAPLYQGGMVGQPLNCQAAGQRAGLKALPVIEA